MDTSLILVIIAIVLIIAAVYVVSQKVTANTAGGDFFPIPAFPNSTIQPQRLSGDGSFELAAVGESNYQRAFDKICGPWAPQGEDREIDVLLILENTNQFDNNAVQVQVQGRTVGYLSRADASDFREWLKAEGMSAQQFICKASIRGGWDRDGERRHYGIWLDVNLFDDES